MDNLTSGQRAVLKFEEAHPAHVGVKEESIRTTFGLTTARYYQLLNHTIKQPAALAEQPLLVKRLLRQSTRRTAARASRRIAN